MTSNQDLRLRELAFIKMQELEKQIKKAEGEEIVRLTAQYQHLKGFLATYNKV